MLQRQKILFTLILLHFYNISHSQSQKVPNLQNCDLAPYHFGFLLGFNEMLFTIKTVPDYQKKMYYNNEFMQSMPDQNSDSAYLYNVEGTPTFGFVIGIVGNLRLGEYFDLRFTPSLTFGERNLDYSLKNYFDSPDPQMLFVTKNIQSTFVEFPLWIKYKGQRLQNMRPYILAGAKYALDMASNAKKKDDNSAANVFINRKDVYALGGVGFDFYTVYFKFGVELSMSYGIFDVLKHDNNIYTRAIKSINSKIFQLSFTFES